MLGTPAYAAPEQIAGDDVGSGADIYALGSILFEILTRQPLHPRGRDAIDSTLARPGRDPQTVIELDALCIRALSRGPESRPSARTLATTLESYLDGDRDIARRRDLAGEQLANARAAHADQRRADAIRAAGRALALDPDSEQAAVLLGSLVCDPPRELPASLAGQLRDGETELSARGSRTEALARSACFLFIPVVLWVGVKDPLVVFGMFGFVGLQVLYNRWVNARRRMPSIASFVANIVFALLLERMFGPLVIVPAIVVTTSVLSAARTSDLAERPLLLVAIAVASFVLPLVLEATGVLAPTWSIVDGAIVIRGAATAFGAVYVIAVNLALIVVSTIYGWALAAQRRAAHQRFEIQAWHLRQLLPRCG